MTPREMQEAMLSARSVAERTRIMRHCHRELTTAIIQAVGDGDIDAFTAALEAARYEPGLAPALRQIARMEKPPSAAFRRAVRDFLIRSGDILREETGNDLILVEALRVLLPPYRGGSLRVYRGDSAWNRRRRTYGYSWSLELNVADEFAAKEEWRRHLGGSVVLEADAPPEAIVSVIPESADLGKEREVVIDRRRLGAVRLVHRYAQLSREEFYAETN